VRPARSRGCKQDAPLRPDLGFADGVRVVPVRGGVTLCSAARSFRLTGEAGLAFVDAVVPALVGVPPAARPPDWFGDLIAELVGLGLVVPSVPAPDPPSPHGSASVALARDTEFSGAVAQGLQASGVSVDDAGQLLLLDTSGEPDAQHDALVRAAFASERAVLPLWSSGQERFYGPLTWPGDIGCVACCRARMSDTLEGPGAPLSSQDPQAVRTVVEHVLLQLRFPRVAGPGWFVVDDGTRADPHRPVPMPWCDVCGGAEGSARSTSPALTQSTVVPQDLRMLADTRAGIVRRLFLIEAGKDAAPELPISCSASIAAITTRGWTRPAISGEGKGATREAAVRSAVGEGIERYSAALWDERALSHASFASLGADAFDPAKLVLYSDEQYARPGFRYRPYDPKAPTYWVGGSWLDSGEAVWVPAVATFMHFPTGPAEQFVPVTSNGLAAGSTLGDAQRQALYELIERDAFMLYWLTRRPGTPVDLDGSDEITERALDGVRRLGARTELYVLDAGTGHPTVVCLGLGDGRTWPGVTIGLAAHANIDVAIRRAVLEHGHFGAYLRRLMLEGRHRDIGSTGDVVSALDHALFYVPAERQAYLAAFRAGDGRRSVARLREQYTVEATVSACVTALGAAGIRTAAVDVTSPDVRLSPVRVVRAFGEFLQPIEFGAGATRTANPRLQRELSGAPNTDPHPIA
jgi:ribosomal protein S12 methylthiotransferase accessory factor